MTFTARVILLDLLAVAVVKGLEDENGFLNLSLPKAALFHDQFRCVAGNRSARWRFSLKQLMVLLGDFT